MRNDGFKTELYSYDEKGYRVSNRVTVECSDYEIFKEIVDVVIPILKKGDVKRDDE